MPILWKASIASTWAAIDWRAAAATACGSVSRLAIHSATDQPAGQ
jgi:hypothetical protein